MPKPVGCLWAIQKVCWFLHAIEKRFVRFCTWPFSSWEEMFPRSLSFSSSLNMPSVSSYCIVWLWFSQKNSELSLFIHICFVPSTLVSTERMKECVYIYILLFEASSREKVNNITNSFWLIITTYYLSYYLASLIHRPSKRHYLKLLCSQ